MGKDDTCKLFEPVFKGLEHCKLDTLGGWDWFLAVLIVALALASFKAIWHQSAALQRKLAIRELNALKRVTPQTFQLKAVLKIFSNIGAFTFLSGAGVATLVWFVSLGLPLQLGEIVGSPDTLHASCLLGGLISLIRFLHAMLQVQSKKSISIAFD